MFFCRDTISYSFLRDRRRGITIKEEIKDSAFTINAKGGHLGRMPNFPSKVPLCELRLEAPFAMVPHEEYGTNDEITRFRCHKHCVSTLSAASKLTVIKDT